MSATDKLIEELRALCDPTAEAMPDGIRLTKLINSGREAADTIARMEEENGKLKAALEKTEQQRDNLWMALLHAKMCFHGGVRSTNPDQRAHDDVDRALAGNGPKDGRALNVAKQVGRIPAASALSTGDAG